MNRMVALVACMFVASLTQGQLYAFSVYGGALKATLRLTQEDLDSIATCAASCARFLLLRELFAM